MSTSTDYVVTGMTCAHCVRAVTEEVGALDGVAAVAVDLGSGRNLDQRRPGRPFDPVRYPRPQHR